MNTTTTTTIPTVRIGTAEDGSAVTIPVDRGVVVVGRPGSGKSHVANLVSAALRERHLNVVHVNGRTDHALDLLTEITARARAADEALIIEEADLLINDAEAERLVRALLAARFPVVIIANSARAVPHGVLERAHTRVALSADAAARLFGDADVPTPEDRRTALVDDGDTVRLVTIG